MEIIEKISASGMRIWYTRPESEIKAPLMIMLHERYGPVEHSYNVIKRMASYGYVACFSDLFHRYEGERGPLERSEARYDPTDTQTINDIDETIDFMAQNSFVDNTKIGIVGFCQSGRTPLVYSAAGRKVSAVAIFHGGIYPRDYEPTFEGQEGIENVLTRLDCPLLGCFGENDRLVPLENIKKLRDSLNTLNKQATLKVFANTPHGWMNETRPDEYQHETSERSWAILSDYFQQIFANENDGVAEVNFEADSAINFSF